MSVKIDARSLVSNSDLRAIALTKRNLLRKELARFNAPLNIR